MAQSYFVTGTDTGVGKTSATLALMHYFRQRGELVLGMKPVASGCEVVAGQLQNPDALAIQSAASISSNYADINPYAYQEAVSPHIAGVNNPLDLTVVQRSFSHLQQQSDRVIVEGAGGWLSALSQRYDNADLAVALGLPVILTVGLRLGCINHARLSAQAIAASGLPILGWIGVCCEAEMPARVENIATLQASLAIPLLGILPFQSLLDARQLAAALQMS